MPRRNRGKNLRSRGTTQTAGKTWKLDAKPKHNSAQRNFCSAYPHCTLPEWECAQVHG